MTNVTFSALKVGRGTAVHYALTINGKPSDRPLCGAGQCHIGTRRSFRGHIVNQPVTCKKCLEHYKLATKEE